MSTTDRSAVEAAYARELGHPLAAKPDVVGLIRDRARLGRPFAAGRLGHPTQYWLSYPLVAAQPGLPPIVLKTFLRRLMFETLNQAGIFPAQVEAILQYNDFFVTHLRQLDCLGLVLDAPNRELTILKHYRVNAVLTYYQNLVPDRSSPSDDSQCYLQSLAGQRLLIVCPFAEALCARATETIFEGVWAKTGKRWFHPASIEALEFPYGYEPETQRRYGRAEALFDDIVERMARRQFDVALIAAAGLAIPLASAAKQMGKLGLDLGGDLQILFGVLGQRWRNRADWRQSYFNEWWIDTPARYRPSLDNVSDAGAYW